MKCVFDAPVEKFYNFVSLVVRYLIELLLHFCQVTVLDYSVVMGFGLYDEGWLPDLSIIGCFWMLRLFIQILMDLVLRESLVFVYHYNNIFFVTVIGLGTENLFSQGNKCRIWGICC